jgi:hypothetical protein
VGMRMVCTYGNNFEPQGDGQYTPNATTCLVFCISHKEQCISYLSAQCQQECMPHGSCTLRVDVGKFTSTVTGIATENVCVTSAKERLWRLEAVVLQDASICRVGECEKVCTVDDGDGVVVKWRMCLGGSLLASNGSGSWRLLPQVVANNQSGLGRGVVTSVLSATKPVLVWLYIGITPCTDIGFRVRSGSYSPRPQHFTVCLSMCLSNSTVTTP